MSATYLSALLYSGYHGLCAIPALYGTHCHSVMPLMKTHNTFMTRHVGSLLQHLPSTPVWRCQHKDGCGGQTARVAQPHTAGQGLPPRHHCRPPGMEEWAEPCLRKYTEEIYFSGDFSDIRQGSGICTQILLPDKIFSLPSASGFCPTESFSQFVPSFSGKFPMLKGAVYNICLCPGFYFTSFLELFISYFPNNVAGIG